MHCSKCGAKLVDGAGFCGSCGAAVTPVQPAPQVQPEPQIPYQPPVQPQVVYQAPAQPVRGLSKKEFLTTIAPASVKRRRTFGSLFAIVCAVILIASYVMAVSTSFVELPMVSGVFQMMGSEGEEALDEFDDLLDEASDDLNEAKDLIDEYGLSRSEENALDNLIDRTEDTIDTPSMLNFMALLKAMDEAYDDGLDEYTDISRSEIGEMSLIFNTVNICLIVGLVWALLFTVIGGLCKVKGLVIAGMIFSILYALPLAGLVMTVLCIIAHAVTIALLSAGNKEYRDYCAGAVTY